MSALTLVETPVAETVPVETPWAELTEEERYRKWLGPMVDLEDHIRTADQQIRGWEHKGLRARWESGRLLLQRRRGERLPNGRVRKLCTDLCIKSSELNYRMKFAEKFNTEEKLSNVIGEFRSWSAITKFALTDMPRGKKATANLAKLITRPRQLVEAFVPTGGAEEEFELNILASVVRHHQERNAALKQQEASPTVESRRVGEM